MSVRQTVFKFIARQFRQPCGFAGYLAGVVMANRPSNRERNDWTLELLHLGPRDRVLEIGFGPGMAIEQAGRLVTKGLVAGIEHSEIMLRSATRRNRREIAAGRTRLHLGSAEDFVISGGPFNKIYSVNVVQFWRDPETVFTRLCANLAPDGIIATTYQPRNPGATDRDALAKGEELVRMLKDAGLPYSRIELRPLKPAAICVLASPRPIRSTDIERSANEAAVH